MRDLTERELMQVFRTANLGGDVIRLTYDSGPYEVSKPTHVAMMLAQAVARKFCAVNGIAAGAPKQPDMLAICEALGFDPTNHHNAAKCPYCRPADGVKEGS